MSKPIGEPQNEPGAGSDEVSKAEAQAKACVEAARQRMVQHESGIGAQVLIDLGLKDIRVLTNHPKKVVALEGYGITIADQVPLNVSQRKPTHQVF